MIGLVSCSATKRDQPAPARELYTSQLFRASLAYAEARCAAVYVLSALHGLVSLDQVLEPYNHRLPKRRAEVERWARNVGDAVIARHERTTPIMLLAGADYTAPLARYLRTYRGMEGGSWLGWEAAIEQPLAGKYVGERLAFLARARREAA